MLISLKLYHFIFSMSPTFNALPAKIKKLVEYMLLLISAVTYTGRNTQAMNVTDFKTQLNLFSINENIEFYMMTNTTHIVLR